MSDNGLDQKFRIDKMVFIAILSVTFVASISFAISRMVIEQHKPGKEETLRLANEAYDRGDFQNSSYLYERYIEEFDGDNTSILIDYGYSLHNVGKSAQGIEVLLGVLRKNPRNAFALFNIAVIYYRDGDKVNAKKWMLRCVEDGDTPDIVEKAKLLLQQM